MQSIIVYRNPLEAAIWESGLVPYIIFWTVLVVVLVVAQESLFKKYIPYRVREKYSWYIYGVILESMILTYFIMRFMFT